MGDEEQAPAEPSIEDDRRLELGLVDLPDRTFAYDLEIGDRYQRFSQELARVALLAMSALGFLLVTLKRDGEEGPTLLMRHIERLQWPLYVAFGAFAITVGAAVAHRYFATESLANHLETLRRSRRSHDKDGDEARAARRLRDRAFQASSWLLVVAASCLAVGSLALAATFIGALASRG